MTRQLDVFMAATFIEAFLTLGKKAEGKRGKHLNSLLFDINIYIFIICTLMITKVVLLASKNFTSITTFKMVLR